MAYVAENGLGKFGDGLPGTKLAADFGRGYRDFDRLQLVDDCASGDGIRVAGPADYNEFDFPDDFGPTVPRSNLRESICANEEKEPVSFLKGGADSLYCLNGVAALQACFETGSFECAFARTGELDERKALLVGFARAVEFVGRLCGWNYQDFVEGAVVPSGSGYG